MKTFEELMDVYRAEPIGERYKIPNLMERVTRDVEDPASRRRAAQDVLAGEPGIIDVDRHSADGILAVMPVVRIKSTPEGLWASIPQLHRREASIHARASYDAKTDTLYIERPEQH